MTIPKDSIFPTPEEFQASLDAKLGAMIPISKGYLDEHRRTITQALHHSTQVSRNTDYGAQAAAAIQAQYQAAVARAFQAGSFSKPKPLEDAGIEVGEIIAWRVWRVVGSTLTSVFVDFPWFPGEIVEGVVHGNRGVHAFKNAKEAWAYSSSLLSATPQAVGKVALWGRVVEHKRGYRAQYARIVAIAAIKPFRFKRLAVLRKEYGVANA
ncbi:MAG: hypothetical protein ACE5HV_00290 [Acidobacteriota bacterium]